MKLLSLDSAVGIATDYGLDGRGVGVAVAAGARFSPLRVAQSGAGAKPVSYAMGTGGGALASGVKRLRSETDHSPPTTAEVRHTWIHTPVAYSLIS
jgi:hypothetical protein